MWQVLFQLFLQFISECKSERIVKIGLCLTKLSRKDLRGCFLLTVYCIDYPTMHNVYQPIARRDQCDD